MRPPRRTIYARVSDEEFVFLYTKARQEGLTMSDYVRRAINSMLLEEGDERLLTEQGCPAGQGLGRWKQAS